MNTPKIIFSIATFSIICLLGFSSASAQAETRQPAPASFEVTLQTLVASNGAGAKTDVSSSLANVVRKLKASYAFTNYRLTATYLQRISNTGGVEFKSVAGEKSGNSENYAPVFSEWSLAGLQNLPNSKGQNSIQFQSLRFGQRIPIETGSYKDQSGKTNSVINYEQIGLTINRFGLTENVPTVVGSLSTANEELIFLILTVKSVEE